MSKLFLVRHGKSVWNKQNKFTGWIDVNLSEEGKTEAENAAQKLLHVNFDKIFTSNLKRAKQTYKIISLKNKIKLKPIASKFLNERHYGDLQGKNKDEIKEIFGEEKFLNWRRSFDGRPPNGESLSDTYNRVIPFFEKEILELLKQGKNVLVVAHGNSLRSIVKKILQINDSDITKLEIATGEVLEFDFAKDKFIRNLNKK